MGPEGNRRAYKPDLGRITNGIFLMSRFMLRSGKIPQGHPLTRLSQPLQQFVVEVAAIEDILGVGFVRIDRSAMRVDIVTRNAIFSETGEKCAEAEIRLADRLGITINDLPDLHIRAKNGFASVARVRRDGISLLQYDCEGKHEDPDKGMVIEFGNFL